MHVRYDVPVPMRDGVRLSTDIYLPEGDGPWPVILQRTPYNNSAAWLAAEAERYAGHGYAYVAQDCRGKFDSDGTWYPHRHESDDGDDTLTWCGTQAWSTGRVGMTGGSYAGATQWYAASSGNPHLQCIAPLVAFSDLYFDHGLRRNGVFQTYFLHWAGSMAGRAWVEVAEGRRDAAVWQVPLRALDAELGLDLPYWRDFVDHDNYDEFWRSLSIRERYASIQVPALSVGGWHSPWELGGTLANFSGMAAMRRCQRLVIGPWTHDVNLRRRLGDYDFGTNALIDLDGLLLRWFNRWLRDEDNGVDREPAVLLFVMGENRWRTEEAWPVARSRPTPVYLRSGGRANSLIGDGFLSDQPPVAEEAPDQFTYNPERPVVSVLTDSGEADELFADRRPIERRDDVLVFTGTPLIEPIEVTGPITATLFAATSAPDTDFVVTLVDVHPDGFAEPVTWGIARGRFLTSMVEPRPLSAGQVAEWTIDLWATSRIFLPGHRVRVDVTSSFFPFFGRNHNTGNSVGDDVSFSLAQQTIHHTAAYPSHVVLPLTPRPTRTPAATAAVWLACG